MNVIDVNNLFNKKDTILRDEILSYLHESQHKLKRLLNREADDLDLIKFMLVDTYNFNIYNSYVGLKMIRTRDGEFWSVVDEKMIDATNKFFSNVKLYNRVVMMVKNKKVKQPYINWISRLLKGFVRRGLNSEDSKILKINKMIRNNERKIIEKLNNHPVINIDKKLLGQGSGKVKVELTRDNYFYLINSIKDAGVRSKIERAYNSKTDNVITDICKIIILRQYYANELGKKSYFEYVNNNSNGDNSNDIKELIADLMSKVSGRADDEIERIHTELVKDGYDKRVESNDIIYYHNRLQSQMLFKPSDVFATLFGALNRYFGIMFRPVSKIRWGTEVVTFMCTESKTGKELGVLYLDISYSQSKKIDIPMFIKLTDKFTLGGRSGLAEVCIMANYKDINSKCMSYNNVVLMFREFGHVLRHLSYESHTGLINHDDSFKNFLPQIMEYIAWERDTIKSIAGDCTDEAIDHLIFGRNIDLCYSIRMRCIQASIDHIIHNSEEFVNLVNESIRDSISTNELFINLYKKTIKEMTGSDNKHLECDIRSIPPYLIIQMINGSEGILYGNIASEVLSYAVFSAIKSGRGNDFRDIVLKPTDRSFKSLLLQFISAIDTDTYNLYLSEIIGLNIEDEDDEIATENTNYFDDKGNGYGSGSDTDSDIEDIIIMNSRKRHSDKLNTNSR